MPRLVVLFEVVKEMLTGARPDVGAQRSLGESDLHIEPASEAR